MKGIPRQSISRKDAKTQSVLFLVSLLALFLVPPIALTQTTTAKAWADSTSFTVGDAITVHVELNHPEKAKLTPLVGDTLGAFHILSRDSVEEKSATSSVANFIVATYDSGTAILPPLEFAYFVASDSTPKTIATNPLIFSIRLVEVDTAQAIKDIKPVLSIPLTVAEWSLILGTIVGAVLLVRGIIVYRRRKHAEKPEEKYVPPPKAAHIIALEELAFLKEKRLWQQGLIKPYYTEVTEIVRRYFEHRFGFQALEQTTDEAMDNLRRHAAAHAVLEQTDRILRRADLVKFAKHQASIPEHEETLAVAFEIVEKTKLIEVPQAEEAKEETASV
jgi:hypothetical protein